MRRMIRVAAGAAAVAVLAAACGTGHAGTSTGTGLSPAVRRFQAQQAAWEKAHPALFHCEVEVDILLAKDLNAIEQGYDGIDPNQVMTQYGVQSAIFQAYIQLQGQLTNQVDQYGTTDALQPVYRQVVATCQQYGADPPPSQPPPVTAPLASPAPAAPAPASSVPSANASGCPGSAQLMAAWDAAPPSARRSWTPLSPSGMSSISCWRAWAVASPVVQANGLVIFREQSGEWHLLPETELSWFDGAICNAPGAPAAWSGPAGPATCS